MINKTKLFSYVLLLTVGFVFSSQSLATNGDFQNTINQLTTKNLKTKLQVVEAIIDSANSKVEFVLQSLLEGKVYYIKNNKKVVLATKEKKEYLVKEFPR